MGAGAYSGERPWRRVRRVIAGPAPAAGVDWSITVPSGKVWRVLAILASLTTDATVAGRSVRLTASDGDTTFLSLPPVAVQAASLTGRYAWGEHVDSRTTSPDQVAALPPLTLQPGWVLRVTTTALQAADAWGAPAVLVVETTVRGGEVDLAALPDALVEVVGTPGE